MSLPISACVIWKNLKSRDGILKAKTEIFKSMNPDGTVILNGDDDKLITISEVYGKKPVFFGIKIQRESMRIILKI